MQLNQITTDLNLIPRLTSVAKSICVRLDYHDTEITSSSEVLARLAKYHTDGIKLENSNSYWRKPCPATSLFEIIEEIKKELSKENVT